MAADQKDVGDAFIDLHVTVQLGPIVNDRVQVSFLIHAHTLSSYLHQLSKYDCRESQDNLIWYAVQKLVSSKSSPGPLFLHLLRAGP
jgi:hypothetical protein